MSVGAAAAEDLGFVAWGREDSIPPCEADLGPEIWRADVERIERSGEEQALQRLLCMRSPWYWLVNWCFTLDEHDARTPYKRFPPEPYLREVTHIWWAEDSTAWPKSRQMVLTWLFALLFLGDAQFRPGRLNILQSQGRDEAVAVMRRAHVAWWHQPAWLRTPMMDTDPSQMEMRFANGSTLKVVPAGAKQIQGYTPSGLLMDEAALHEEARETFEAAQACIAGGGRMTMVSRCDRSWWFDVFLADKVGREEA